VLTLAPLWGYSDILSDFRRSDFQMTRVAGLMSVNNQRILIACFSFCYTMGYLIAVMATHLHIYIYSSSSIGTATLVGFGLLNYR